MSFSPWLCIFANTNFRFFMIGNTNFSCYPLSNIKWKSVKRSKWDCVVTAPSLPTFILWVSHTCIPAWKYKIFTHCKSSKTWEVIKNITLLKKLLNVHIKYTSNIDDTMVLLQQIRASPTDGLKHPFFTSSKLSSADVKHIFCFGQSL